MEIEAKIKLENETERDRLEHLVKELGGSSKYLRVEINVFYDTQKRRLKTKGEALRLRKETYGYDSGWKFDNDPQHERVSMTFKGRRKQTKLKIRPEHEFGVTDFDQARLLLQSLGYKEYFRFEKKRRSYHLEQCLVEFDHLPYLGHFVEIEGTSEKKINKVIKLLGLVDRKLITEGYGGLLLKDAVANGRGTTIAEFDTKTIF